MNNLLSETDDITASSLVPSHLDSCVSLSLLHHFPAELNLCSLLLFFRVPLGFLVLKVTLVLRVKR